MRTKTWLTLFLPLLIATLAAGASDARAQDLYRVRGTLKSVTADQLVITSREGEVMGFRLDPESGRRGHASDHRRRQAGPVRRPDHGHDGRSAGRPRGASVRRRPARPGRGSLRLGPGQGPEHDDQRDRGADQGRRRRPGAQGELSGGEPKVAGTQTIYLPPDVPIVHMAKADRALLAPGKDAACWSSRIATRPRSWSRSWSATRAPNHPCERRPCRLCGTMAAPGGADRAGAGLLRRPTGRGRTGTGAGHPPSGTPEAHCAALIAQFDDIIISRLDYQILMLEDYELDEAREWRERAGTECAARRYFFGIGLITSALRRIRVVPDLDEGPPPAAH